MNVQGDVASIWHKGRQKPRSLVLIASKFRTVYPVVNLELMKVESLASARPIQGTPVISLRANPV